MKTDRSILRRAVFVVGPTSAGKSSVAIALAQKCGGEIVNADAFQLYRELPVLGAQPSATERADVVHHLFGCLACADEMDAARYAGMALPVFADVIGRGRIPFVVGGSGLYLQALMAGLPELPAIDLSLRETVRAMPLPFMVERLRELDPASALSVDVQNPRRVARRLELCLQTGRPASAMLTELPAPEGLRGVVLVRERADLAARIADAVASRLRGGAIDEVRAARATAGPTARQILGWHEITAFLDGDSTEDKCREDITLATRRYAKRQLTWFRGRSTFAAEIISSVTPETLDRIARQLGLS